MSPATRLFGDVTTAINREESWILGYWCCWCLLPPTGPGCGGHSLTPTPLPHPQGCWLSCGIQGTGAVWTILVLPQPCFPHFQMHQCVDPSGIIMCCTKESLWGYRWPINCRFEGRYKGGCFTLPDAAITLILLFLKLFWFEENTVDGKNCRDWDSS